MTSPKTPRKKARTPRQRSVAEFKHPSAPENNGGKKNIRDNKKGSNKGGRPPAVNRETVRKLVDAFENDFTLQEAWDYAGIKKSTYYDYMNLVPGFSDRMRRAMQFPLTLAKRTLFKQIKGTTKKPGDGSLSLRLLERRQSDRYKIKIQDDTPPSQPIIVIQPGSKAHPRFTPPSPPKQ